MDYYEPFCITDCECIMCEQTEDLLKSCTEFLQGVIEQLYSNDPLDLNDLEACLEELCSYLKVKTPEGEIQVKRKKEMRQPLQDWLVYNNLYLQQLASY